MWSSRYNSTDDFSIPWRRDENRLCKRNAQRIFDLLVKWDNDFLERVDNERWLYHNYRGERVESWVPGPLYVVQIPVVKAKKRRPRLRCNGEVVYFPRVLTDHESGTLVNLGARPESRLLVADLEYIPRMPLPFRDFDAPPGFYTPGTGYRMTKYYKGKFRLQQLGHARSPLLVQDDMYCPFCPGLKIKNGRELFRHCMKMDYRHKRFPQLMYRDEDDLTCMLCGEIWDAELMVRKYGLERSDLPMGGHPDCTAAHRGFGMYFQLRYREAYETWQHARLIPGLKEYFNKKKVGDCWDVVNAYLKW